jgi:acetate kinase
MKNNFVLVLNCGSSSLKFAVIDSITGDDPISGLAECFNLHNARIKWKIQGHKNEAMLGNGAAHQEAIDYIVQHILGAHPEFADHLKAVGHRVVHGGEKYTHSMRIDDAVLQGIEDCAALAPLHNPAHLIGIREAKKAFANLPQVAVFDTAFHQTMPEQAFLYALPYELYQKQGVRRYGMHGTSHYFISQEAAKVLQKPVEQTNIISCHLGNGASVCAIKDGQSVDTSMGFTPLEGLVMGTRCGDIDPSIIFYLKDTLQMNDADIQDMLNKKSGLLGLSEQTSDCRGIEEGYEKQEAGATRALDIFCYRLAKYIAAYSVPLTRIDAIVFTGGIGENSDVIREKVLNHLAIFGYQTDATANKEARFGQEGVITTSNSPMAMVIPTNEEWVIAQDAIALI